MPAGDLTGIILDDRYQVLEVVAEGAMGVVYRAERLKLGRIVAIKVLHDSLPNELSSRQRFEIEARAMAKLEHPHVAAVLDVGVHGDRPYVVMDFVSGRDLKDTLADIGPLSPMRAAELVRQVLTGLAAAHEHGIIHRDIKPANLVLSHKAGLGDHVKILDFGLARLNRDSQLTSGLVVGTPSYMAPEQIRGAAIDHRVDLYACGVVLFELLTNAKPFVSRRDDAVEVCTMHLKQPPPTLAATRAADYGALEAIVARALAKRADDRYQTADAFARALAGYLAAPAEPLVGSASSPTPVIASTEAPLPDPATLPPPVHAPSAPAPVAMSGSGSPVRAPLTAVAARTRARRQLALIAGGGALGIALVLSRCLGSSPPPAAPRVAAPPDAGPPPAPAFDHASDVLVRATALAEAGRTEAAIELVVGARGAFPRDARLPRLAGELYFTRLWWSQGLRQLRDAVRLAPAYRKDPALIKLVLRAFITTPRADSSLAAFLREDIGAAARPFLAETATSHPNASIRARAAAELKRFR